jgi:hypothetical protein
MQAGQFVQVIEERQDWKWVVSKKLLGDKVYFWTTVKELAEPLKNRVMVSIFAEA